MSKGKVHFTPLNTHKNLIFDLQLQNRITRVVQLSKPDKFRPLRSFVCLKNKNKNSN